MARTLDEVIASLPPDQQQEIAFKAAHLIGDEAASCDFRKTYGRANPDFCNVVEQGSPTESDI